MEIILETRDGSSVSEIGSRFQFPSLPKEISVKNGANYQSYKIIGKGAVKIPKGTNCEEISWDGYFFGPGKRGELMIQNYAAPRLCVEILERLRNNGTPLKVMCTGVGINRDMTISSFQWRAYGGHGNVKYSISFSQWKDLRVKVLKSPDPTPEAAAEPMPERVEDTPQPRPEPPPATNYTIVSGDTLWAIGQRNGVNWQDIYAANADVIEAAARSHGMSSSNNGNWIWPGTTLTIPTT